MSRTRGSGFSLIEILVALTIVAALASTALLLVPIGREKARRTVCQQNLADLGGVYQLATLEEPAAARARGTAQFLEWRRARRYVRFGEEEKLLCPGDPGARFPRTEDERAAWDAVAPGETPPGLCSYAGRDPRRAGADDQAGRREIVACDRQGDDGATPHHEGGLNVLYDSGAVVFVTREMLGLGPDDALRVGPDSPSPTLRALSTD